jgi:hypothetical protein
MEYQYSMEYYIPWNTVFYRILIPIQYNTGKSISVEYNTANSVFRPPLFTTLYAVPSGIEFIGNKQIGPANAECLREITGAGALIFRGESRT